MAAGAFLWPKAEARKEELLWLLEAVYCSRSYCSLMKFSKYQFLSSLSYQNYSPLPLSFPLPPHAIVQPASPLHSSSPPPPVHFSDQAQLQGLAPITTVDTHRLHC